MKVLELLELEGKLNGIKNRISKLASETLTKKGDVLHIPFEFTYALTKNGKKITSFRNEQVTPFTKQVEAIKKEEKADEHEKKALEISEEYAIKNEKGVFDYESNVDGLRVAVAKDAKSKIERDEALVKLKDSYKGLFTKIDELNKKYKEFIDSELKDFEFYTVKIESIPDFILPTEMDSIADFIKDEPKV